MPDCKELVQAKQIDIQSIIDEILDQIEIPEKCFGFPYTSLDMGHILAGGSVPHCYNGINAGQVPSGGVIDDTCYRQKLDAGCIGPGESP